MPQLYEPEFKKKIARLRLEGRTIKSLTTEFGVSKSSINLWTSEYTKECQNEGKPTELETLEENRRLRKELEEVKKENLFLKKAAAFFAKEIE